MGSPGEASRLRASLAAALAVFGVMALPMLQGRVRVYGDLTYYFLPFRSFLARCIASGADPAWFPDLFGGFFLFGEGTGMAHPWVQLLYRLFPLDRALNIEMLAGYPLLFLGFILLLRRWNVPRDAAAFGALLYAFGGYNLMHYMHISVMCLLVHLPWLLLATDTLLRTEDRRRMAQARIAVSLLTVSQLLFGHVQFAWISGLGEFVYVVFVALRVPGAWRRLGILTLSKAFGIVGAAIQIGPLWDAFNASKRERPSLAFVAMGSLPPASLLQWVAPYLTVSDVVTPPMRTDEGILAPAPSMADWRVHEFALYYGAAVPALLIWLALNQKRLGDLRPLAVLAAVTAVGAFALALGENTPLFWVMTKIPIVGRFRLPSRYLVLFHLAISILVALAYAFLCARPVAEERRPPWRRLWPLMVPLVLSVLVCLGPRLPRAVWPDYLRGAYLSSTPWMLAGPLLVGLATALVTCAARGARWALLVLPAFAAADQAAYAFQDATLYPATRLADFLAERPAPPAGPGARVTFEQLPPTLQNPYAMKGVKLVGGYASLVPRRRLTYDRPASLRVAGVSFAMPAAVPNGQAWRPVPDPLPRARLVTRAQQTGPDPNRDLDAINVATTALVERPVPLQAGEPGQARLVGDRPGKLDIVTEASTRQLLVVSESHHPGWRVRVDGRDRPVLRVNGDFLGCLVPAGKHHARFRFRPLSLRVGGWLSVAGLLLSIVVPCGAIVRPPRSTAVVAPYRPHRAVRNVCTDLRTEETSFNPGGPR